MIVLGACHDDVRARLRERGHGADRELSEAILVSDLLVVLGRRGRAMRFPIGVALFDLLPKALSARGAIRSAMTTAEQIGSYPADVAPLLEERLLWRPLRVRCGLLLVAVLGGWAVGLNLPGLLCTCLAVLTLGRTGSRALLTLLLYLASWVFLVLWGRSGWWFPFLMILGAFLVVSRDHLMSFYPSSLSIGTRLGFVPAHTRAALVLHSRWGTLSTAVGFALGEEAHLAQPFIDHCEGRVPAECIPVLTLCRARVAADGDRLGEALEFATQALDEAEGGPPSVHAWCAMHLADLLDAAGRPDQAHRWRGTAEAALTARGQRRLRQTVRLRRIAYEVGAGDGLDALGDIHALRLDAVRHRDSLLLDLTEQWLMRLALHEGNVEGAAWTLRTISGVDSDRRTIGESGSETAAKLLLRADTFLSAGSAPDLRRAHEAAESALRHLQWQRRPLAAATAHRLMALVAEREGRAQEAVSHAVTALAAIQQARYGLPSTMWRNTWSRHNGATLGLALRLSYRYDEAPRTAQLLELARGQALPDAVHSERARLLNLLDAILAPSLPADAPATAEAGQGEHLGIDPTRRPPPVRTLGQLATPPTGAPPLDLERELALLSGTGWYWCGVTVGSEYIWAVRSPEGAWWHGLESIAPGTSGRRAYEALRAALPLVVAGESGKDRANRLERSALAVTRHTKSRQPEAERELLGAVAATFLPHPLAEGLAATPDGAPTTLAVSLSNLLGLIPVAGLPLRTESDVRVVERTEVVHVPAWSMIERSRTARNGSSLPTDSTRPVELAVLGPDGDPALLAPHSRHPLRAPASARRVLTGSLDKEQLLQAWRAAEVCAGHDDWVLFIAGHVLHAPGAPGARGLRLAPVGHEPANHTYLSFRDLAGTSRANGSPQVPRRVVLAGCESLGLDLHHLLLPDVEHAPDAEWLGLAAGMVAAGAQHVYCTLHPVPVIEQTLRIDQALAEAMSGPLRPAAGLRQVQLAELERIRRGESGHPMVWQTYVYVGTGHATSTVVPAVRRSADAAQGARHDPS